MKKCEFTRDAYFGQIKVAVLCIVLNPTGATLINSVSFRAIPKQQKIERKEIEKIKKTGVPKPAVAKWALLAVFVTKKDGNMRFLVNYWHLNAG